MKINYLSLFLNVGRLSSFITFLSVFNLVIPSASHLFGQDQACISVGGPGNDQGHSLVQSDDGGFVIVGQTNSFGAGGTDVYVVKLAPNSAIQWTKTIGGAADDYARSVTKTTDGGYAIAGSTKSYGAGGEDIYVIKLDRVGNIQWTNVLGGSGNERAWEIIHTRDSGYAIAGSTNSFGAANDDMYILKLNALGILEWDRKVDGSTGPALVADFAYSIVQSPDDGFAVCGTTFTWGGTVATSSTDIFLVKLAADGTKIWSSVLLDPSPGNKFPDFARSITLSPDGGYLLGGEGGQPGEGGQEINSWGGNWHYLVAKFDENGSVIWTRFYGGSNVNGVTTDGSDYLESIYPTSDGGYILVGWTFTFHRDYAQGLEKGLEIYLVKITASGSWEWSRVFGDVKNETAKSIVQTTDGGYAVAGYSQPRTSGQGSDDIYFVKLDSTNNSCYPSRSGGGERGTGGTIITVGNDSPGGAATANGGDSGEGGVRTDFCSQVLASVSTQQNTCTGQCDGEAAVYVIGGVEPYFYNWDQSSNASNNLSGLCPGNYIVTITDQSNNTISDTITIEIEQPELEVTIEGALEICEGDSVVLTAETGFTGYSWSNGIQNASAIITSPGTYTATATNQLGCLAQSQPIEIISGVIPVAQFTSTQTIGYLVEFTNTSTSGISYIWDFGGGVTSSDLNPIHTFPFDGTYQVTLIATNQCGSDTLTKDIIVLKTGIFSPVSSVRNIQIVPNPTQGHFNLLINGVEPGKCRLSIYNYLGVQIAQEEFIVAGNSIKSMSLTGQSKGIYLVKIEQNNQQLYSKLIIY